MQDSWAISDNRKAFEHALQSRGYFLAKGDKRGYVAVDLHGEVYSLSRQIGVKKADLSKKLGKAELLSSVANTKNTISGRLTKQFKGYSDELNFKHKQEMKPLIHARQTMIQRHRETRENQKIAHEKRWQAEELERSTRLRKGFKGIWDRLTGSHQKTRVKNEKETQKCHLRDQNEKESLVSNQLSERRKLQDQFQQLRDKQTDERQDFFSDMDQQYKNIERQDEIRELYEQETLLSQQTISNKDSMGHEPEM